MGIMVTTLIKCSIETTSLVTSYDYAIAHVVKIYRGAKMDHKISYQYSVKGNLYTSGAEWNDPIQIGGRFIVRYGKFAPNGNRPVYGLVLPDSIVQDSGQVWTRFLALHNL
jgi:hypothetical protein